MTDPISAQPKYTDAEAIAAVEAKPEILAILAKGATFYMIPISGGWDSVKTGSGNSWQEVFRQIFATGVTASSTSLRYSAMFGFNRGARNSYINWGKKFYFIYNTARGAGSDSEVICRVQVKEQKTLGDLGENGIGIIYKNYALYGESYGASGRAEIDLSTVITTAHTNQLMFILDPDTPKIEWYFNGSLVGTQSTAGYIPTTAAANIYMLNSMENGVTGGTDCNFSLFEPMVWQEA